MAEPDSWWLTQPKKVGEIVLIWTRTLWKNSCMSSLLSEWLTESVCTFCRTTQRAFCSRLKSHRVLFIYLGGNFEQLLFFACDFTEAISLSTEWQISMKTCKWACLQPVNDLCGQKANGPTSAEPFSDVHRFEGHVSLTEAAAETSPITITNQAGPVNCELRRRDPPVQNEFPDVRRRKMKREQTAASIYLGRSVWLHWQNSC